MVVFRIGTLIPVPGIDPAAVARFFSQHSGGILGIFNMFSGGALQRLSIFAMGVMPYISASIIIQMMAMVVPSLDRAAQGRPVRPAQDHRIHPLRHVVLAVFQSFGAAVALARARHDAACAARSFLLVGHRQP